LLVKLLVRQPPGLPDPFLRPCTQQLTALVETNKLVVTTHFMMLQLRQRPARNI